MRGEGVATNESLIDAEQLFNRSNPAPAKYTAQYLGVAATIEIPIRIDNRAGTACERRKAVQLEVAFKDDSIRDIATYSSANFPKRR